MATQQALSARDKKIAAHREMAELAFRDHVLTVRHEHGLFASWRCAKPNDGAYAFNITIEQGRIFVTGDVGALVVERTDNMIAWCRGAIRDIHYLAQKVPHEIQTTEWCPDVVRELLDELLQKAENELSTDEIEERQELVWSLRDLIEEGEGVFCHELSDSGLFDGCDWPDLENWKSRFLWCRECIRWFLEHSSYDPYAKLEA